jgi:hypothetical protein
MLVVVFSIMAFLVSPLSVIDDRCIQDRITAFYLPAIFIWWFVFLCHLKSIIPGIYYSYGYTGLFVWKMNSAICYAFGLAFSLRLLRLSRGWPRAMGAAFAVVFFLVALFGETCRLAVQQ